MTSEQQLLWDKVREFETDDPGSSLTFTDRLARENGWSIEYAIRAVHEYKKFIFLLCIADHSLTPSDQVDQVWHLHMIYTRSYWIDLCQDTLGRQIHHGPTRGGQQESNKYNDLYEKTLHFYRQLFEREAPADIWPPKNIRFADVNFLRVNTDRNWIIKKPGIFRK
jgi:hypothetical protein